MENIFGPEGLLSRELPGFEFRPSQLAMAQAVLDAIRSDRILCVEAGTGTGKTLAYLLPALLSKRRLVVSTATRNLQDQIFFKDLPFIRRHFLPDLRVTYMKGRSNYLCLRKLEKLQSQEAFEFADAGQRSALSEWAQTSNSGDRAELDWLSDKALLWREVDARSETCVGQKCDHFDRCFITRMRRRAYEAELIVVNHALLFSNLAIESDEIGRVLPDFSILILDEAHEVEDSAAEHFGVRLSSFQVEELCRDLVGLAVDVEPFRIENLQKASAKFFGVFGDYEGRFSLDSRLSGDAAAARLRGQLQEPYGDLESALVALYHALNRAGTENPDVEGMARRVSELSHRLELVLNRKDESWVSWFETRERGVIVYLSPIRVASILREKLLSRVPCVILTSATLTVADSFDYLRARLELPEAIEISVPGEFDFSNQAILYVPKSFPEPRSKYYLERALEEMRRLLDLTSGHAFLLFTSHSQMDRVYTALQSESSLPILKQGMMPKNRLLEVFRATPGAVLCATSSFWQGVDVKGDALRLVVIDKLPFQVPTEPLVQARLKLLEKAGQNAFLKYSVPQAAIALKQGLGRLIRSSSDRGILAVLDSRIWSRSYGELFLRSLPNCPVTDKIDDLENFFL